MAAPDMDVIKEIPGYKVILKAILKAQIQQLVEQLAEYTEEDSIILTASIHDGTLSHLGSDSGKSFLDDHEDVKSQFLGFCLKYHHKKKQEKEREEREEAMRKAAAAAANTYTPRHYMPTHSPRHPSPRFMGARHPIRSPAQRHQPYPITRPIRAPAMPVSTPSPLRSPQKFDGQIIKIEPEDSNDETSNQDAGDSGETETSAQHSSQSPSQSNTPSKVKSESGEKDDDAKSESSNSTIPNEPQAEGLSLDSDLSNLISGNHQQQSSETSDMDPNVNVKLEALTENEMELEITGVEPGRPVMSQDNWDPNVSMGMNFDPTGATGNQGDMTAQGYNQELYSNLLQLDHNYNSQEGAEDGNSSDQVTIRLTKSNRNCCVPECKTWGYQVINGQKVMYHIFPSDKDTKKKWIKATRVDIGKTFKLTSGKCVCSLHFKPEDYITTGYSRPKLKKGTVPSQFKCWDEIPHLKTRSKGRPKNKLQMMK